MVGRGAALRGAILIVLVISACAFEVDDDEDDFQRVSDQNVAAVTLEHDLEGDGVWTPRSKMTYTGPKLVTSKSRRLVSVHMEQTKFSPSDAQKLQQLIDEEKQYRVRVPSNVNNPNSKKVMASIPACLLASAQFREIFHVHVDQYGNIRSLWYQTMATECHPRFNKLPEGQAIQLVTSVSVDMESKGAKLLIEPQVKVVEESAKPQEEQSFIKKYWMYIVFGILIVSLMTGEDSPDPKKGGAGGGGARGGGAAGR